MHVSGVNFVDVPTMCRFGTALVDAKYISPTLLSCISPILKVCLAPFSITLNGVDFVSNETLVYESITLPQILSIEPVIGVTCIIHSSKYDSRISLSRLLKEHPDCQQVSIDQAVPTNEFIGASPNGDMCVGGSCAKRSKNKFALV